MNTRQMMVSVSLFVALGSLVALTQPTDAQAPAWQALYYTQTPNNQFALYSITADDVTELPMPADLSGLGERVDLRAISPDHSTVAGIADGRLFFADLAAQTCCTLVEDFGDTDLTGWTWGEDGGFNADGSQFAISAEPPAIDGSDGTALLVLVDVARATGLALGVANSDDQVRLRMGGWEGDAVLAMPVPYCTEFCGAGPYQAFTIYPTGIDIAESQRQLVPFGQQLPTTLEIVAAEVNETWQGAPLVIGAEGPFTPPNTLVYQQTVIHYDPSNPYMDLSARWVADGRAVMVGNVLIWRDGLRQRLDTTQVAGLGTPDGWLRQDRVADDDIRLLHISATPDALETSELARFPLPLRLLEAPLLGTSLGTPPPFTPLADVTEVLACAGNLPPRLVVEQQGIVLPGQANNVRSRPNTSAERVSQLATNAQFTVFNGPVCADGFTWWNVAQDGPPLGWTAEGDATEYWLAPLG